LQVLEASLFYFAVVFSVGFVFGTIRTLWVAPRLGGRRAELLEAPIMLLVSFLVARWSVLSFSVPSAWSARLLMGGTALGLMLVAELALVFWVRGVSIREYFATRDPISGIVYYVVIGLFALMPLLLAQG
jgi:uncharacterized membrane protein